MRRFVKQAMIGVATLGGAVLVANPSIAQNAGLAMLAGLERGEWEVRFRDGSPSQRLCVRSGTELLQLRHKNANCNRFVVEDGTDEVTVQYTCRGNGYGRSNIRRESASLVQIESQGIANGQPFQFTAEARRAGACR